MHPALRELLRNQDGVVARRQALAEGLDPHDLRRLVRHRELMPLRRGVLVNHTGEPTLLQHCWAGVLLYPGSALAGEAALRLGEGPGSRREVRSIEIAVDRGRHLEPPAGITVVRLEQLQERVLWNTGPPRMRYEEAALDVADRAATDGALGELSRAVQSRRTTAARLLTCARARPRLARRRWIEDVLGDVATGACSVLEHGYLTHVERPHALDSARRQDPGMLHAQAIYRDIRYRCGVVVELDGRLFHDTTTARDADFDRDLDAAAGGSDTRRLSYGQVFDRPCWTASRVARVLQRHGWEGAPRRCGPACPG